MAETTRSDRPTVRAVLTAREIIPITASSRSNGLIYANPDDSQQARTFLLQSNAMPVYGNNPQVEQIRETRDRRTHLARNLSTFLQLPASPHGFQDIDASLSMVKGRAGDIVPEESLPTHVGVEEAIHGYKAALMSACVVALNIAIAEEETPLWFSARQKQSSFPLYLVQVTGVDNYETATDTDMPSFQVQLSDSSAQSMELGLTSGLYIETSPTDASEIAFLPRLG